LNILTTSPFVKNGDATKVRELAIKKNETRVDPNLDNGIDSENSETLLYLVTVEQAEQDEHLWRETIRSTIKPLVDDERAESRRLLETYGAQGSETTSDRQTPTRPAIKDGSEPLDGASGVGVQGTPKAAAKRRASGKKKEKGDESRVFDPKKIKVGSEFGA